MIYENILWIFQVWFASLLMGLISWPFSAIFFNKISDRGYSLSKIIGWVVLSYSLFVLATIKVVSLSLTSLIFLVLVWTGINFFIERQKKVLSEIKWKQIILIEIMFLALLSVFSYIKGHQPEIYQIERWMDFGFIQALFNTDKLPLFDIWFLGENLNYYYFGHVIGYAVLSLSRISLVPGFYILTAWIFSLLGINVYRLGKDLILLLNENAGWKSRAISGVLSFFNVILAGTMYSVLYIYEYLRYWIWGIPVPFSFYPAPTRIIPGTITEMPIYSYIVAENHAHYWGLLSGVMILGILYALWTEKEELNFTNKKMWMLSFLLGIAYMINTWDALTLGILSLGTVIAKYYDKNKIKLLICCGLLPVFAYIFGLPWTIFFKAPLFGIGIVKTTSSLINWISFWGIQITIIAMFLAGLIYAKKKKIIWEILQKNYKLFLIIITVGFFFLGLLELIYVKDILKEGEWYRANTFFKVYIQIWLWWGIIIGPMIVWMSRRLKRINYKLLFCFIITLIILVQIIYPIKAIQQAHLDNKKFTGIESGLNWWKNKYSQDHSAYLYLTSVRDNLPPNDKIKNIVEAEGESYTDASRFSVFLGWPTIIGWPVHEWTWRGNYDEVRKRREEVKEIYTGKDLIKTKEILEKYKINYVIAGEVEKEKYKDLNYNKLMKIGKIVFDKEEVKVIEVG